jgi:hypothetical protein
MTTYYGDITDTSAYWAGELGKLKMKHPHRSPLCPVVDRLGPADRMRFNEISDKIGRAAAKRDTRTLDNVERTADRLPHGDLRMALTAFVNAARRTIGPLPPPRRTRFRGSYVYDARIGRGYEVRAPFSDAGGTLPAPTPAPAPAVSPVSADLTGRVDDLETRVDAVEEQVGTIGGWVAGIVEHIPHMDPEPITVTP